MTGQTSSVPLLGSKPTLPGLGKRPRPSASFGPSGSAETGVETTVRQGGCGPCTSSVHHLGAQSRSLPSTSHSLSQARQLLASVPLTASGDGAGGRILSLQHVGTIPRKKAFGWPLLLLSALWGCLLFKKGKY